MKRKDLNDLKNKSRGELAIIVAKTKAEITMAEMELRTHRSKNTNAAKNLRRNLAQILTICKTLPVK